jgi:hypothetical protein
MMNSSGEGRVVPPKIAADTGTSAAASFAAAAAVEHGSPGVGASRPTRNSLLRYSPAVVLLAILIADSNRHTDPDLWGHIRSGQAFIANRHLIGRDPYSYSAPGAPWYDYEWLAEVVMAFAYNVAGVAGLKLWKLACTALTVIFIADSEAETGASFSTQLLVLLLAALGLVLQMQLRPQMFTFVLLGALLALLTRDNYGRRAPLWLAIPLMVLWVNLHAGFFLGVITLALYTGVATLCDLAAGEGWRRGARLGVITVVASAATLANPLGVTIWEAVGRTLVQPYTRGAISEWQPTIVALAAQWHQRPSGIFVYVAVAALVVGLAAAFAMTPRGGDLPLIAVAAIMAVGAWLSVRNMALAVIAAGGPLARHLALISQWRRGGAPPPASRPVNQWVIFGLCVALVFKTGLFSNRLGPDQSYPAGALEFMREHNLHGNVLSEWGWGGYLIWHSAPENKVFVDGRSDSVYPLKVTHDFLLFRFNLSGAANVLDAYPHDFVLISTTAPARHLMERRHDWKLLYRDNDALLYARTSAPAANLPGLPVTGAALPGGFP